MAVRRNISFAVIAALCFLSAADAPGRTFTDNTGRASVEAELVKVENGKAHIKRDDNGRLVAVALGRLSEADRKYVRDFVRRTGGNRAPVKRTALNVGRAAIERELAKTTEYEFDKVPLTTAIERLSKKHGLQIVVERRAMERFGVSPETPVTGKVKGVKLREAIELLLKPLELSLTIRNDRPVVTSEEAANQYTEVIVYRVMRPTANPVALIEDITDKIAPNTWDDVGGFGSICPMSLGVLVVLQTDQVHGQLAKNYSRLLKPVVAPEVKPSKRPAGGRSTPDQALRQVTEFKFEDTSLSEVATYLGELHRVKIAVNDKALDDCGISADLMPFTLSLSDISLASALEHLFDSSDLTYVVGDDALVITSLEDAESTLVVQSYKVADLMRMGNHHELIETITSTIDPIAWEDVGGRGSIKAARRGEIQISQTARIHKRVERLLEDLRRSVKR